ncbi:MAG: NYN domain-containing protein [Chlamydiia bacterium]|nr:NYN domain-containing protein [Chlamydiia bacterium]
MNHTALYLIDGYNLLFRSGSSGALQNQRESLIDQLVHKLGALNLEATVVFDAMYQLEDSGRSHKKTLEVIYTRYGETADQLIVDMVREGSFGKQCLVITSDKALAAQCRIYGARTQSVEAFRNWLDRRYQKLKAPPKFPENQQAGKAKPAASPRLKSPSVRLKDPLIQIFEEKLRQKELPTSIDTRPDEPESAAARRLKNERKRKG